MEKIKNSIYKIITAGGSGTGFKIESRDFVITNYHVIEGSKLVAVEDQNKNRFLAKVVMANPDVDLAFLDANDLRRQASGIRIDPSIDVKSHQKVNIAGFPLGLPFAFTSGIVSSPSQQMDGKTFVQTDAAVNPGNSGGPMLTDEGIVVAVTTAKFEGVDNMGFGIKHTDLIKEIDDFVFEDGIFRVKCSSCDTFIEKETEFCPNCGNNIDQSVFEEFEKSHFATFVEESLEKLGTNPILCRAGRDYWEFHQGSALVRIFVVKNNYLYATSPLNELPKKNLKELLRYINSNQVAPYHLGIYENKIYISYRTHLSDIYSEKKDEIRENLMNMVLKADELDDFFKDTYGCEMALEGKEIEGVALQDQIIAEHEAASPVLTINEDVPVHEDKIDDSVSISETNLKEHVARMKVVLQNVSKLMAKYDEYDAVDFEQMQVDLDRFYTEMKQESKMSVTAVSELSDQSFKLVYEDFFLSYKAVLKDMKRMVQSKELLKSKWMERIDSNHVIYDKMMELYQNFKKSLK